nr:MAG TPA: hypothetical protein [Caudoviricetes sp.]
MSISFLNSCNNKLFSKLLTYCIMKNGSNSTSKRVGA